MKSLSECPNSETKIAAGCRTPELFGTNGTCNHSTTLPEPEKSCRRDFSKKRMTNGSHHDLRTFPEWRQKLPICQFLLFSEKIFLRISFSLMARFRIQEFFSSQFRIGWLRNKIGKKSRRIFPPPPPRFFIGSA